METTTWDDLTSGKFKIESKPTSNRLIQYEKMGKGLKAKILEMEAQGQSTKHATKMLNKIRELYLEERLWITKNTPQK